MQRTFKKRLRQLTSYVIFAIGAIIEVVSSLYVSSFLAILGVAIVFWGVILLYITPSKHVPLTLLNATTDLTNIERILAEVNFNEKGIYLPPRSLKNVDSSVIYIPEKTEKTNPGLEEINEKLFTKEKNGLFLTPPGLSLSRLFEQELGYSFTKIDLTQLQNVLPKLLVETMEMVENAEMKIQGNMISIEVTGSVLDGVCQQTQNLTHTHDQIGCILTSAIACILAKVSGKPVTIRKENKNYPTKITQIEYRIEAD